MLRNLLAFLFLTLATITAFAQEARQRLADFRRVVVDDHALPVTRFAAEDLAEYAGRVAGAKLEIVPLSKYDPAAEGLSFFVGEAAGEKVLGQKLGPWKQEEWMLKTVPQGLILAGDDKPGPAISPEHQVGSSVAAGSQLATYTFLDDTLGVKWLWPGPFGEHVPSRPEFELPHFDVRRVPDLIIRSYIVGYPPKYHTKAFSVEAAKWQRRTRQAWVPTALFRHSWEEIFGLRDKQRAEQLLKEHPEWFALHNGKRHTKKMCTTNPEVLDIVTNFVLNDKNRAISSISPEDGGGFCECENCRALDIPGLLSYDGIRPQISDRIFTYANEIARRVREKQPGKGVGIFAYTYYNEPPVKIERLEPNLYISFVFQAMAHVDPAVQEEWKQRTQRWKRLAPNLVMREGWGNHYLIDMPFPHDKEIIEAFQFGYQNGFIAAYGEGSKAFASQAPNAWAAVRMMWDPKQDPANLMKEFYRVAYGPAADAMEAYFGTFRKALEENYPKRHFIIPNRGMSYSNILNSWHLIYPAEILEEAEKHLQEAERIAPPGEYADRVKFTRFGFEYTRNMLELLRCYRDLAQMGVKLKAFENLENLPRDPARERDLLRRAYELGEKREDFMLAHRDWAAVDEGLYAHIANGRQGLPWHNTIKKMLGIRTPSRVTEESLKDQP